MSPLRHLSRLHAQRRSGAGTGVLALLTALLCLAAQVAGVAHQGLVNHVRCVEHDALVHADAAAEHEGRQDEEVSARGVPADLEAHGDDHCLAADLRRRDHWRGPATLGCLQPPPASDDVGRVMAARDVPPAAVAPLILAPKSGPPAPAVLRA